MKILLINKSPVVSELLAYALKDTSHSFKEIDHCEHLSEEFDLIILDEPLLNNNECLEYENKPCIFLSTKHFVDDFKTLNNKALIIQKPFLPTNILEAINSLEIELKTTILNKEEIEKIHSLLRNDSGDESINNAIGDLNLSESTESINEGKDNINYIFDKNLKDREKEMIDTILSMKPKKLKKFLKNSNIRLNIEIKDN